MAKKAHPEIKGSGIALSLLRAMQICGRKHGQITASDLRAVVRIQTKNKHPHSTKKHK